MSEHGKINLEIAEQIAVHLRIHAIGIASGAMRRVFTRIVNTPDDQYQAAGFPAAIMDDIYQTIIDASNEVGDGCMHQVVALLRNRGLWSVNGSVG